MRPKEKAKEIIDKMYKVLTKNYANNDLAQIVAYNMWFEETKQNALITVDEVLNTFIPKNNKNYVCDEIVYWKEVETEIHNFKWE